jgi:hypothetical protein
MRTIIYKHVTHINTDELDSLNRFQTFPDLGDDEDLNEIYLKGTNHLNTPVKIDYLRGLLDQLETKGANFVSIDYHSDHIEYELDGVLVTEASQQEIDDNDQRDKEFQLKFAKAELERIEKTAKQFRDRIKELSGEQI